MKNTPLLLLPLLLAAVLTGCTGTAKLAAYQKKPLPKLEYPLQVREVVILDGRMGASAGEIKLPLVSAPGTHIKHVPALTAAHRDVLENTIRAHTTNRGPRVKGVITIEEAYEEFSSTWSAERERGFAQLTIAFYSLEGDQLVAERTSSGDFLVQSIDATPQKMEEVYRLALRNVLYECLKNLDGSSVK
ncbi:MAG TPA: hypothetical protein VF646_08800 [Cytophagales bacterium]|jgi:hypothetical protein